MPPKASTECARPTAEGQERREGGTQRRARWWQGYGRPQEQWAIGVAGQRAKHGMGAQGGVWMGRRLSGGGQRSGKREKGTWVPEMEEPKPEFGFYATDKGESVKV